MPNTHKPAPQGIRRELLGKYKDRTMIALIPLLLISLLLLSVPHILFRMLWCISFVYVLVCLKNCAPFAISLLYDGHVAESTLASGQSHDMMSWRPPDRPWTEPTGIRCVERLKAELLTAEAGLTEVTLLERQLKNGAGKMDDSTRYMLYKAHQAVRDRCAGNEDIARDRVRRIEWIIAGNVASEIRDREEELWRLNRERARVIGKDYMTWYVRGLDENVRSVERTESW